MARFVTLSAMRTAIQVRGAYENSTDITASVLDAYINEAIAETWDILRAKRDDRLVRVATLTTTINQDYVDLTTLPGLDGNSHALTFLELRKLEIADPSARSGWRRLRKVDLDVSHLYATLINRRYRYRLQGPGAVAAVTQSIVLHPTPQAVETLRMFYIPAAPILTAGTDNFDTVSSYDELVYQLAFKRCKERQEQDTRTVDSEIQRLAARISVSSDGQDVEPFYLNPHGAMGRLTGDDDDDAFWSY